MLLKHPKEWTGVLATLPLLFSNIPRRLDPPIYTTSFRHMPFCHMPICHSRFPIWASSPYADSPYISQFAIRWARARTTTMTLLLTLPNLTYMRARKPSALVVWPIGIWRIDYGESAYGEKAYGETMYSLLQQHHLTDTPNIKLIK